MYLLYYNANVHLFYEVIFVNKTDGPCLETTKTFTIFVIYGIQMFMEIIIKLLKKNHFKSKYQIDFRVSNSI